MAWLSAWVTAPPDKGRANAALIELLADALGVPASAISLESGAGSRLKRLRIDGGDDIAARLARLMEQT